MNKSAAIVVTYNRLQLLKENLNALRNQSEPCDIIVINNASTDETETYVLSMCKIDNRIIYHNTGKNLGGAGGFAFGIKVATDAGYRYIWIMDDDSIPMKDALKSLQNKAALIDDQFSFMASTVYWTNGKLFRMNTPHVQWGKENELCYIQLLSEKKIVPIQDASFVGCFVNIKYVHKVGLPISEFFIYGDDIEYTSRLSKEEKAYLDLDSIIIHKAPSNTGADIVSAPKDRLERFYYQSRNGIYIARREGRVLKRIIRVLNRMIRIIIKSPDSKFARICILLKGTLAGFIFNPSIQFVEDFKETNRYD